LQGPRQDWRGRRRQTPGKCWRNRRSPIRVQIGAAIQTTKIARLGSFRAAAVDLDVSPTAIGNAVANLENRLGVRLFNRTPRNVALTSAGREYAAL
jgi:hypothetical protein